MGGNAENISKEQIEDLFSNPVFKGFLDIFIVCWGVMQ
jgi:hypothetical protein